MSSSKTSPHRGSPFSEDKNESVYQFEKIPLCARISERENGSVSASGNAFAKLFVIPAQEEAEHTQILN